MRRLVLIALGLALVGCGGSPPTRSSAPAASPVPTYTIMSVTDGDTVRITPAIMGATAVRFLNIDAPESGGDTQEPWAAASTASLRALLPAGAVVQVMTDRTPLDSFGRLLGHVVRAGDGLNVNREQVRTGNAVLYCIWPNAASFEDYRQAQIEAQDAGPGIWSPASPLLELPFLHRQRIDRRPPERWVGDFGTRYFVEPPDYASVHVNNRMFFNTREEAVGAGYRPCPLEAPGHYSSFCFGSPR